MMTIPRDEEQYWEQVALRDYDPAFKVGMDDTAVPDGLSQWMDDDMAERIREEARRIRDTCPTVWEILDKLTRPGPHDGLLMQPSLRMSFGERMAYHAGQDSIGIWLRRMAEHKEEDTSDA